jgi:hypothetical protein
MDGLLLVRRLDLARGVDRHGRREHDRGRVLRRDVEPLAERRDGRRDDPLREALVVDLGYVVDAQALLALRGEQVLAAQLQRDDDAAVVVRLAQQPPRRLVRPVLVGVGELVEAAADDRLRLVALGDHDAFEAVRPLPHPGVAPDEVHEPGAVHQQLRHPGVVVPPG